MQTVLGKEKEMTTEKDRYCSNCGHYHLPKGCRPDCDLHCDLAVRKCSNCWNDAVCTLRFGTDPICEDCALP